MKYASVLVFSLGLLLVGAAPTFAGVPDTLWSRTYGGQSSDVGYAVARTTDSGFVIAGSTSSFGPETADACVVRTDGSGNLLWFRRVGGAGYDEAQSVCQTFDGGYAIGGWTSSADTFIQRAWLARLDADGGTIWTRTYGGTGSSWVNCLIQTADSGFLFCGGRDSANSGGSAVYLVRTNSDGVQRWSFTYGVSGMDVANAAAPFPGGGFAVCGVTFSGQGNAFLLRVSETGSPIWVRNYGTEADYDWVGTLLVTPDTDLVIAGEQGPASARHTLGLRGRSDRRGRLRAKDMEWDTDLWLLRVNAGGDSLWSATWGDTNRDCAESMQPVGTGGWVVAATDGLFSGTADMLLLRFSAAGDVVWTTRYPGLGGGAANGLVLPPDGGYAVVASTDTRGAGADDVLLVKFGSDASILDEPGLAGTTRHQPGQTIARGVLFLPSSLLFPRFTLLSIDGRKAMDLAPGANDVRGITPGVYFVMEARSQSMHKVIVSR